MRRCPTSVVQPEFILCGKVSIGTDDTRHLPWPCPVLTRELENHLFSASRVRNISPTRTRDLVEERSMPALWPPRIRILFARSLAMALHIYARVCMLSTTKVHIPLRKSSTMSASVLSVCVRLDRARAKMMSPLTASVGLCLPVDSAHREYMLVPIGGQSLLELHDDVAQPPPHTLDSPPCAGGVSVAKSHQRTQPPSKTI